MVDFVDETLLMHGGRERSVAATKTFTGQMMLFYMLAAELAETAPSWSFDVIPSFAARARTATGNTRFRPTLCIHGELRRRRARACLRKRV